jgi:4-hydroxy-tetrahydrodipicolinate reductase
VTLITGTRKGIGKFLVEHYVARGHQVVGCSRSDIDWEPPGYRHFVADVIDEATAKTIFSHIRGDYGQLDNLINNAGIDSMNHTMLTPLATVEQILDTNVVGSFQFAVIAVAISMTAAAFFKGDVLIPMDRPIRLVVLGAGGRMGQRLVRSLLHAQGACLHAAVVRLGSSLVGKDCAEVVGSGPTGVHFTDDMLRSLDGADGVLDFTQPEVTLQCLEYTSARGLVHIIGTTGFNPEQEAAIAGSQGARIVKSGNMSVGVQLLSVLAEIAGRVLPAEDWDAEVLEMHHRHKVDAPSGTALMMGEAVAKGRQVDLGSQAVRVRDGLTGPREVGTIGFATLRGGSVVGDHSLIFAGEGEVFTLSHQALDRQVFTRGALRAARWAWHQPAGVYSMQAVLGLAVN